ncbi:tyrosine-type recombinase/integrase [Sphaerisporangium perillae]|uniref:tyrosine-type recombinase/integrase n=1 Tax=Sphaerisporangium perillae TaxID=2935860 RepID=UPI00200E71D2|nr:site-specific integrase [Sphaerisporangium perillae]
MWLTDTSHADVGHVPAERATPAPPAPRVFSVGDIAGLRPRRRRGDGGEVPGPDVDLVDSLDRDTFGVVAAWLRDKPSAATRQTRLQVLAAFLRWLDTLELPLLQVTEDELLAYRDAAATGTLTVGVRTPGKPLGPATVAKQRNILSSFYDYARRRKVLTHNPALDVRPPAVSRDGTTEALTVAEQYQVRAGIITLADERPVAAAAVALLAGIGTRIGALPALTVGDIRTAREADGSRHTTVAFRNKGGKTERLPVPSLAAELLQALRAHRPAIALLFAREDGRPVDRWWVSTAITQAAIAGGIPKERARALHPHMLRATVLTQLLEEGVPADRVKDIAMHTSVDTTLRYDRRRTSLTRHPLYELEDKYEDRGEAQDQAIP